jgi:hypothetical protein
VRLAPDMRAVPATAAAFGAPEPVTFGPPPKSGASTGTKILIGTLAVISTVAIAVAALFIGKGFSDGSGATSGTQAQASAPASVAADLAGVAAVADAPSADSPADSRATASQAPAPRQDSAAGERSAAGSAATPLADARPAPVDSTPTSTPTRTPAPPAANQPYVARGRWVAVLDSKDKTDTTLAEARAQAAQIAGAWGVPVDVFDSSTRPGMRPGYWALVLASFDSNEAARAACASVGRVPSDACSGRQITG